MLFKKILNHLLICTVLTSCQSPTGLGARSSAMVELENDFFKDLFSLYPRWGSASGKREYDAELPPLDSTFTMKRDAFLKKYNERLQQLKLTTLSESEQSDVRLLQNYIHEMLWEVSEFRSEEWDASRYNVADSLAILLESKMPEADRKRTLLARLQKVPAYYESAIGRLKKPTKEHLHLAIQQNKGTLVYLENTVKPYFQKTKDSAGEAALVQASAAVKIFVEKLEKLDVSLQKNNGYKSFRLGPALYKKKFAFDMQAASQPEDIYAFAIAEKEKTLAKMAGLTEELWKKYFPKKPKPKNKKAIAMLVARLSEEHSRPEEFEENVRTQIPALRRFVEEKNLLGLDPTKTLTVRATPEYEQGFAIAGIDAPGPFDPERETFYNVIPFHKMDSAKIESFLKEYNNYTLQILNIHEAIPGHYAQLVYSKKSPSLVKSIMGNGAMVEGWAVYAERMMMENGYGNGQPELWLMYYKWYLRVVGNAILDYEIHNKNLSRTDALRFLMEDIFQERTEAEYKWERATYSQVQLATYFTGFSEIYRLREEMKKNKNFNLRQFHEDFLSYGSAPVGEIARLMRQKIAPLDAITK
ncbi:MAG: DUF885 domain-containing protein [Bdellovibrionaceae bacterium]|nr:DUF885 domain-containing protein [Pseudobdellovibrionaceae bacterium]